MGLTFRHWDSVEGRATLTCLFVWMKGQGEVGDFCWRFPHSVLILSCCFSSRAPLAPFQVIPLESVWDVWDKGSQGITSIMTFLSSNSDEWSFLTQKIRLFFFKKSIIARTSSTRAGKWSLMFIRALRAAAGFWKTYSSASKGPWCSARLDVAWENLGAVHHTLILCLAQSTWGVLSTGKIFWVLPVCLVRCSGGLSHYPACGPVP